MLAKGEGYGIVLDLHITTFKSDIISDLLSCVQFTINNYIQDYYNLYNLFCYSWHCAQLFSNQMLPQSL